MRPDEKWPHMVYEGSEYHRWISSPLSATIWFSGALCLAVLGDWAPRDAQ